MRITSVIILSKAPFESHEVNSFYW
jgi:hypothetical protein